MELSRREFAILRGVVEQYIWSGRPVASGQVARSTDLRLSPATIRSVMASLEERGFLSRSHPSAGCVPADRSFRVYVDSLDPNRQLPASTRSRLKEQITANKRELVEDMEWVARVTADVTQEAGMAVRPMDEGPVLEAISLVHLGGCRVLGVVVTNDGAIEKRVLNRDQEPTAKELQRESDHLNRMLRGLSVERIRQDSVREAAHDDPGMDPLARQSAATIHQLFNDEAGEVEVQVAGADRLLDSEDFAEPDRMRLLVNTLQDRKRIASEWRKALDHRRTQVIIGRESELTASGNLGMVATLFYRDGRRVGALGVVGPRRMDYGRIVPMVEFIGDTLTQMLGEPGAMHA